MDKEYTTVNELDLEFFRFIHKRNPKNEEEFMEFQKKLDIREQRCKEDMFFEDNFSYFYTATTGKRNPFSSVQCEYDGYSEDED